MLEDDEASLFSFAQLFTRVDGERRIQDISDFKEWLEAKLQGRTNPTFQNLTERVCWSSLTPILKIAN
jgi:hypothetical protein